MQEKTRRMQLQFSDKTNPDNVSTDIDLFGMKLPTAKHKMHVL
jgi:hypothetical protein